MIRILHIIQDEKFVDPVSANFESWPDVSNTYVYIHLKRQPRYKYITKDSVRAFWVVNFFSIWGYLKKDDYDVAYFHSIPPTSWIFVHLIPKNKKIVWWGWGYDLYNKIAGMKPVIELNLYKHYTELYCRSVKKKEPFINKLVGPIFTLCRRFALKKIDYFQPVLPKEIDIINMKYSLNLKEFYPIHQIKIRNNDITEKGNYGGILFGNSASITNNHIDVWDVFYKIKIGRRQCIFPLSYGDCQYAQFLKSKICAEEMDVVFMDTYLPRNEYYSILESCSYAVMGSVRQEAMGNIFYLLTKGVKLFLYRDSIAYKSLKFLDFKIFSIDDDLNEYNLTHALTQCEIEWNVQQYNKFDLYRYDCCREFIKEVALKK